MPDETSKSALLVMDVQDAILDLVPDKDAFLARIEAVIAIARQKQMRVIFSVVSFRDGAPEASASLRKMALRYTNSQPTIAPIGDDVVVVKRRTSAFTGSDLEVILRAQNIRHLVLAGLLTSVVVLSTQREASNKDIETTILSDACADPDAEVQALLMNKIFPLHSTVMTSEQWA